MRYHQSVITLPNGQCPWYRFKKRGRSLPNLAPFELLDPQDLKRLQSLHLEMMASFSRVMAHDLDFSLPLDQLVVDQMPYSVFRVRYPRKTLQVSLILPTSHQVFIFIDTAFLFDLLRLALGVHRKRRHRPSRFRAAERLVVDAIVQRFLSGYVDAWGVPPQTLRTVLHYSDHHFDKSMQFDDTMLVISPRCGNFVHTSSAVPFTFAYSLDALYPLLQYYDRHRVSLQHPLESLLPSLTLPLSVEIGETVLRVDDIKKMEVGDVIQLEQSLDQPLSVIINHRFALHAYLGKTPSHDLSVQIASKQLSSSESEGEPVESSSRAVLETQFDDRLATHTSASVSSFSPNNDLMSPPTPSVPFEAEAISSPDFTTETLFDDSMDLVSPAVDVPLVSESVESASPLEDIDDDLLKLLESESDESPDDLFKALAFDDPQEYSIDQDNPVGMSA